MPKLFDITTQVLTRAIEGVQRRHQVITNNIANVDTPDFQPADYRFEKQLQHMLDAAGRHSPQLERQPFESYDLHWELRRMFPRVDLVQQMEPELVAETYNQSRLDGNPTDIDREMAKLAQNTIQHSSFVQLINAKLRMLRTAMKG